MNLCPNGNFASRCCRTCSEDYYDVYDDDSEGKTDDEDDDDATTTDNRTDKATLS